LFFCREIKFSNQDSVLFILSTFHFTHGYTSQL
jgi:hypothetical protein